MTSVNPTEVLRSQEKSSGDEWTYVTLPNGDRIIYIDENHSYWEARIENDEWVRGKRIPSVSTLIKPLDHKPERLLKWAARENGRGIAQLASKALANGDTDSLREWLLSHETIWDKLESEKLTFRHTRSRKADVGTAVHQVFESLATGKYTPEEAQVKLQTTQGLTEIERPYVQALVKWWMNTRPIVLNQEQFVYSRTHRFTGRFDLRYKTEHDSTPILCDLKTSNFIAPGYHAQLALYDLGARECGVGPSEKYEILQVKPDGTYVVVEGKATHEDGLAAIQVYRATQRIERKRK